MIHKFKNLLFQSIQDDFGRISSTRINIFIFSIISAAWTIHIAFFDTTFSIHQSVAYGSLLTFITTLTGLRNVGTKKQ